MTELKHLGGPYDDAEPSPKGRRHKQAATVVILGAAVISTSGLPIRSFEAATEWQVVFWRGLALAVEILGILFFQHRGATFEAI